MKKTQNDCDNAKFSRRMFFNKGTLLILLGVIFVIFILDKGYKEDNANGVVNFGNDWYFSYEDSFGNITETKCNLPCTLQPEASDKGVTISKRLPEIISSKDAIFIDTNHQEIEVYIDGRLVKKYGEKDDILFGNTPPSCTLTVELKEEYAGKLIEIHYSSYYSRLRNAFRGISYGTEKQFLSTLLDKYKYDYIFGILFIVVGILWLVAFKILHYYSNENSSIYYLGYFALFLGLWVVTSSYGRQLFTNHYFATEKVGYILLSLLIVPCVQFVDAKYEFKYRKIANILLSVLLTSAVLQFTLDITGICDMVIMKALSIILILVSIIFIQTIIFLEYLKKKNTSGGEMMLGSCIMATCGVIKLAYTFAFSIDDGFSNIVLFIGAFLMITIMGIGSIKEILDGLKRKRELEKNSNGKTSFLTNMSHEIRTPITAMLGMDEMILKECDDDVILGYATTIKNSGKLLLSLINDILDFSKIESGKMKLNPAEYETISVVSDVISMIRTNASSKNLEIITNIDSSLPTKLYGDNIRLSQILINIMNNAVKYTKQGSVTLDIKVIDVFTEDEKKICKMSFKIIDTGIGMKKEEMSKLFVAFERLDQNYTRTIEGTGLGMSITDHYLKMMNSNLQVDSEYGKGSTFYFELTQVVLDASPMGEFEKAYEEYETKKATSSTGFIAPDAKLLIVDDNEMNLEVISGLLKETKMKITTATSGTRTLELLKENQYDVLFIDHMMPGMDGIVTLSKIRELGVNTPAVALTANAVSSAREMYLSKGFQDYVVKPIEIDVFMEVIKKYLPANLITPVLKREKVKREKSDTVMNNSSKIEIHSIDEASANGTSGAGAYAAGASEGLLKEEENDSQEKENVRDLYLNKYGIDIDDGIKFSAGKVGKYKMLLTAYIKFDGARREKFNKFIENSDMENYAIEVHALKGNARSIGANTLGDIAYEHEKRSKNGEIEYIKENYAVLLDEMDHAIKGANEILVDNRLLEVTMNAGIKADNNIDKKLDKVADNEANNNRERRKENLASNGPMTGTKVESAMDRSLGENVSARNAGFSRREKYVNISQLVNEYDRSAAIEDIKEWISKEPNEDIINVLKKMYNNLEEFMFDDALNDLAELSRKYIRF